MRFIVFGGFYVALMMAAAQSLDYSPTGWFVAALAVGMAAAVARPLLGGVFGDPR